MANNNNLFNAALGGAATGLASRAISDTNPASYASQAALVAAFATAFDGEIAPIVGGGSRGQADVVSDICAAYWRDRIITSSGDLTASAQALAAYFTALDTDILPDTGGGGGTLSPVTDVFWIDAASALTGGTSVSNGTEGPYPSLTTALAGATPGQVMTLYPVAGNYFAEGLIDFITAGISAASIVGVGTTQTVVLPPLDCDTLDLTNVQVGDFSDRTAVVITSIGQMVCHRTAFGGAVNGGNLFGSECTFGGDTTLVTAELYNCTFVSTSPGLHGPINGWQVDANTLAAMGSNNFQSTDIAPANVMFAGGYSYLYMQDIDQTIALVDIDHAIVAGGTFSATRILAVDLTLAPTDSLFVLDVYDDISINTLTVNGTLLTVGGRRYTFQIVAGVLTLVSSQRVPTNTGIL